MKNYRFHFVLQQLVVFSACVSVHAGFHYGPVLPPPSLGFGNVAILNSPPSYNLFDKALKPTYNMKVNDYHAQQDDFRVENGESTLEDDPSSEPSSDYGFDYHHQKKHHVVLHKHVHKGHVVHDHKHEGDGKHWHKHDGHAKHEHHHEGEGHHEHKHLGSAGHKHKHEGHADHEHKHKGSGEHKHDHWGAGKHEHKHSGHSDHGHKHEGWADHKHKHEGHSDNSHHHGGAGKHEHKHWGESDHEHKHLGHGEHKHSHKGHASTSHSHKGHGDHKHSHFGDGTHDHKHSGHGEHKHSHIGHSENKHSHKGSGYISYHDDHPSFFYGDESDDLIDIFPKKKNNNKVKETHSHIDAADFAEFISSLKKVNRKEPKPTSFDDDYEITYKKKSKKPKVVLPNFDSFDIIKPNNNFPKHKENIKSFNEEYLKYLSRNVPHQIHSPQYTLTSNKNIRHSFINRKSSDYKVEENVQDIPRKKSNKSDDEDKSISDEEKDDPNLTQYNVVHKESDTFPSMSYFSQVRS